MLMLWPLVTCQHSLVCWPGLIVDGLATKVTTCGTALPATVTVIGAVTLWPDELVAVRMYVVVAVGVTVALPLTFTLPTPLLMLTVVALFVAQLNVEVPPGAMLSGLASK